MDPLSGSSISTPDVQKLPDKDKLELQNFLRNESQKATIQQCTSTILFLVLVLSSFVYHIAVKANLKDQQSTRLRTSVFANASLRKYPQESWTGMRSRAYKTVWIVLWTRMGWC